MGNQSITQFKDWAWLPRIEVQGQGRAQVGQHYRFDFGFPAVDFCRLHLFQAILQLAA